MLLNKMETWAHNPKIYYCDNLRANAASSKDNLIPSDPLSREYNIVDGIATHDPIIS